MSSDEIDLAAMAETLAKSQDYRVLRRLTPRTDFASSEGQATKVGILIDLETAGLNTAQDEIIELAMVKFDYVPDDRIGGSRMSFHHSTSLPIPYPRKLSSSPASRTKWCQGIDSIRTPCQRLLRMR